MDNSPDNQLRDNRLSNYFDMISCTLAVYDLILTFDREVALVWQSPWSIIKALFLLTRYSTFIDIIIVIWQFLRPHISEKECQFVYESTGWLLLSGIFIAEVILMIRTWAVYQQRRAIAIGLAIWTIVTWVPNMASLGIFLKSLRYGPVPQAERDVPGSGCFVVSDSPIVFVCWALLMIFEAGILGMMIYKGTKSYRIGRDSSSVIFKTVFRDGTVFYLYLFVLSTANVIVIVTAPADLANLLSLPERMIHAILTARIILNLREIGSKDRSGWNTLSARVSDTGSTAIGGVEFAPDTTDGSDTFADRPAISDGTIAVDEELGAPYTVAEIPRDEV
ncbi:hypothetical protein PsYK624_096650 [Phanerochaete sordida]|uniref:DUF6533 domain-containing protein n=1 Tax=Phanerochaete sordida TaxID=48140 RepID=A0A9P3LFG0_9APHY|nr:hypothetical protein PsYK624_096650 [Phanerochaete sordida]